MRSRKAWLAFAVVLLVLTFFCILRLRGKTLKRSTYTDNFGEISVKEIQLNPLSLDGLLGLGGKHYRCEYRKSPQGVLESAISLQGDSYEVQQIEISWHSARKATVSLDQVTFYEVEEGIWKKISKNASEGETTRQCCR